MQQCMIYVASTVCGSGAQGQLFQLSTASTLQCISLMRISHPIIHTSFTQLQRIYIVTVYVYLNICVLGDISNIPCISCMYVLCAICIEDIFVLHIYYI